ncbi:hypothetical protein DPMN_063331 [Dreissena polymorpha]|uniref:Uncharacterized protein n=1 Tax=Dreissena polymorpha TaxID=45954 RepID=A0A9D4CAB3_DREPO|nr:hypothetical protein DPMN_063331 [Dreissena polymorpha]
MLYLMTNTSEPEPPSRHCVPAVREKCMLPSPILLNRPVQALLSSCHSTLESAAVSSIHGRVIGQLQGRPGHSALDQKHNF